MASYPGPIYTRCSQIWRDQAVARGVLHFEVHRLHQKYGDVVRIAPDELSYVNSDVWKDVWARRPEVPKSRDFYDANQAGDLSIIGAENPRHADLRRLLAHGFSDKAIREQEPVVQHYANLLLKRLYEQGAAGKEPVEVVKWYEVCICSITSAIQMIPNVFLSVLCFRHHWRPDFWRILRQLGTLSVQSLDRCCYRRSAQRSHLHRGQPMAWREASGTTIDPCKGNEKP